MRRRLPDFGEPESVEGLGDFYVLSARQRNQYVHYLNEQARWSVGSDGMYLTFNGVRIITKAQRRLLRTP